MKIKDKWYEMYARLSISIKLSIMYMALLVLSLSMALIVYTHINDRITKQKNIDLSMQSLYSLRASVSNLLDSTSYNSRIIMANTDVQRILQDEQNLLKVANQKTIAKQLVSLMDSLPYIHSIYIFDHYGNQYGVDKQSFKVLGIHAIEEAEWYKEVEEKQGYYIVKLNAEHIFKNYGQEDTISLIRIINSTVTMKPIGTLMINISNKAFRSSYEGIDSDYSPMMMLLDEKNKIIFSEGYLRTIDIEDVFEDQLLAESGVQELTIEGSKYLCSYMSLPRYKWKAVIGIPMKESEKGPYQQVFLIIIGCTGICMCLSFGMTSRIITMPIKELVQAMQQMEEGHFKKVMMKTNQDEIGTLKNRYNEMVDEIEKLIHKIYEDQKFKRKAELRILQEQVKPHFLYNTIDAMRYLAYTGQNEELGEALEAFGGYYRTSLSKGSEVISVKQEIDLVKDYLYLQKMRYGDIISVAYDIEPETLNFKIPKLILQPLVENAIYHGIKPRMSAGVIDIRAYIRSEFIYLEVEDNGVGMTEEELAKVNEEKIRSNEKSFGLRGTCERVSIYFEHKDLYYIESQRDMGTKITFKMPLVSGEESDD